MMLKEIATEFAANESQFTVEAYASTRDRDLMGDVVAEGAFAKTIGQRGGKIAALWQHDHRIPVGKAIHLAEDARGLLTVTQFNRDTDWGRNAFHAVKAGDVTGVSIGFDLVPGKFGVEQVEGKSTRVIREVKLWEYSFVTFPANESARVQSAKALPTLADAAQAVGWLKAAEFDGLTAEEMEIVQQILADLPSASKTLSALAQPPDSAFSSNSISADQSTSESGDTAVDVEVDRELRALIAAMQFHQIRQEIRNGR